MPILAVALGGALGAVLRWALGEVVPSTAGFPWATFCVNVTGASALGWLVTLEVMARRPVLAAGLGPGLLGGYTTLSAFADEARALVIEDRAGTALVYVVTSVVACVVVVAVVTHLRRRDEPIAEGGLA